MTRIIVKLSDAVPLPYEDAPERYFTDSALAAWQGLTAAYPFLSLRRLITAVDPAAVETGSEGAPQIGSLFVVDVPAWVSADELAAALGATWIFSWAHVEAIPVLPAVNAGDDPLFANQGHLRGAPEGIDAVHAWSVAGGDGTGIRFIDVEYGWLLQHEDIAPANVQLVFGDNSGVHNDHGTMMLGIVLAADNAVGGVGIVPKVTAEVVSAVTILADGTATYDVPNAMAVAISRLGEGGVLLLELAGPSGGPLEMDPALRMLVHSATLKGITVIEPAGNGPDNGGAGYGLDLDAWRDPSGAAFLNRNVFDSGAVMVGAANSPAIAPVRGKSSFSSYGARVDCFAWGDSVQGPTALNVPPYGPTAGTSSASAIVAGAAVATQGMAKALLGQTLPPRAVRELLSHPAINTPSAASADRIGAMPNLLGVVGALQRVVGRPAVEGAWASIRTGHELVYVGRNGMLDWEPATKHFRVWRIDPLGIDGDPLPGPAMFEGTWTTIGDGHRLIYLGDQILDWVPASGDYRVFQCDWSQNDFLPGPARLSGNWVTIRDGHELAYLGGNKVLDWEPMSLNYRVWQFDRYGGVGDPLPGAPVFEGVLPVLPGTRLIPVDTNVVLAWEPNSGAWGLWWYNGSGAGEVWTFSGTAGIWTSIAAGHELRWAGDPGTGHLLDWEPSTGAYRLFAAFPPAI